MKIAMKRIAEYWWEGRQFKHPETGHMVQFKSLPLEEQKRLNDKVKSKDEQEAPKPKAPEVPKSKIPSVGLEEEAKKYKSAEEFVASQIQVTKGLKHLSFEQYNNFSEFMRDVEKLNDISEEGILMKEIEKQVDKAIEVWGEREDRYGEVEDIPIENIELVELEIVKKPTSKRDIESPILVLQTDEGLKLIDGRHRLDQAVVNGQTTVKAIVQEKSAIRMLTSIWNNANKQQQKEEQGAEQKALIEEAKKYEDEDEFIDVAYKRQIRQQRRVGNSIAKKIGGKYTRKVRVPEEIAHYIGDYGSKISAGGDDLYFIASSEKGTIYLPNIATMKKGSGLGTKFMNALKEFADDTSQKISIYKITNAKFFKKFDWLESKNDDWEFQYTPKTDNFVGVADLRDIWNKVQKQGKIKMADITVPLDVGDEIMVGRFKNKTVVVKGFGTDDKGQPTVKTDSGGEHPLLKFRIKKLMK